LKDLIETLKLIAAKEQKGKVEVSQNTPNSDVASKHQTSHWNNEKEQRELEDILSRQESKRERKEAMKDFT